MIPPSDDRALPSAARVTFSTDGIAAEHRFDAWRALLGQSHEIGANPEGFHGTVASTTIDRVIVREMTAAPQSVARSARRVRADGLDFIVLHLTTQAFDVDVQDRHVHVPAGAITLNTLSRPFRRGVAAEQESIILSLSRDLLTQHLPNPEAFHGTVFAEGGNSLLGAHMLSLARYAGQVGAAEAEGIARSSAQLLAAILAPSRSTIGDARRVIDGAIFARCKQFIDRNLHASKLSPDAICRHVGLSRSALYRLFEPQGGVASYIRTRRLHAARAALCAPNVRRVSDIARRFGFDDMPTFSRQFRTAYGVTPREMAGRAHAIASTASDDAFESWMRAVVD